MGFPPDSSTCLTFHTLRRRSRFKMDWVSIITSRLIDVVFRVTYCLPTKMRRGRKVIWCKKSTVRNVKLLIALKTLQSHNSHHHRIPSFGGDIRLPFSSSMRDRNEGIPRELHVPHHHHRHQDRMHNSSSSQ